MTYIYEKKEKKMTYAKLQTMEENNKAYIASTAMDGTCQLWNVEGHANYYVVLCDNSVITQDEDNQYGPDEATFPL
jgi:hypothetical protein